MHNSFTLRIVVELLYFLIPFALLIATIFLVAFIWASQKGQFDDLKTPAYKAILDDDHMKKEEKL